MKTLCNHNYESLQCIWTAIFSLIGSIIGWLFADESYHLDFDDPSGPRLSVVEAFLSTGKNFVKRPRFISFSSSNHKLFIVIMKYTYNLNFFDNFSQNKLYIQFYVLFQSLLVVDSAVLHVAGHHGVALVYPSNR